MASKPTEMCVIETTGAREYKVRMNSSLFVTIMTSVSLSLDLFLTQKREMDNYIPSGKWPSFLSIIFFSSSSLSMMIFLTPRAF